ncbi:glutathione S-transferase family protein [Acinetobacter guillouiae]|uniref:glutathione S-transferase family protein n=2 Tax=Acinetobacter TaxID=469 RepID=UPI003AF4E937
MTMTLHHLNASRSLRILWLLEEIKQPYEVKHYSRNKTTHLAPEELKQIHPLGKSPVLELNGKVIVESGAIVETLIQQFAPHLAPAMSDNDYIDYLQWIHFAESSAMVPYLLKMFNNLEKKQGTTLAFLDHYTEVEFNKVFSYLNDYLKDRTYLVADRLTGADFMMGFVVYGLVYSMNIKGQYPHIERYVTTLERLDSWKSAMKIEHRID